MRHAAIDVREELIRGEPAGRDFHLLGSDIAQAEVAPEGAEVFAALQSRIRDNKAALLANFLSTVDAAKTGELITPAAEWLLDNPHIVEESFRHLMRDLSPRYVRSLPAIAAASGGKVPAAAALAWQYVARSNSELSIETLTAMVEGFQDVRTLRIGEIWAIPAMLRLVLLENLRRIADRVARARRNRAEANKLADKVIREGNAEAVLTASLGPRLEDTRASQLLYRFRDGLQNADQGMSWLDRTLAAQETDTTQVLAREHARQSVANVLAGSIIRSLKRIDETNWIDWFESVSKVDRILRGSDDFARADRFTRNSYRDTIERIARRSTLDETQVAVRALELAGDEATGHVLVGARVREFETACDCRPLLRERFMGLLRKAGWLAIFSPALILTVTLGLLLAALLPVTLPPIPAGLLFGLGLLVASEGVLGLLAFLSAQLVRPAHLPAYDFRHGIPEEARTLVVIPCLLQDFDTVDELVGQLELHFLANPDGAVDFALLTDWPDSDVEETAVDRKMLEHAQSAIEALANKYKQVGRRFYLMHRRRVWNAADRVWMGWERKRGKLAELNELLLDEGETTYLTTGPRPPSGIRFVITLDSDTRLPRGTVAALVGKMMHPVNRPVTDPETGHVTAGHGLIQPRITASLTTGAEASVFQHTFSVGRGMDPYVFAVSDLWQDVLDEGTFTGKGIYDLSTFHAAIDGKLPENAVLSHDLIEGAFARAALATDVQMVEDFPVRYDVDVSRQHRWVRGDWQLLPFILDPRNGLNGIGRLKMIDNLRRSLVAPGFVAASVLGWLALPPSAAWRWQLALLAALFLAPTLNFIAGLLPSQRGVSPPQHAGRIGRELVGHLQEIGLRLIFVAHTAAVHLDAIGRTLWRLTISRRRLLEWRTAQAAGAAKGGDVRAYYRAMVSAPSIATVSLAVVTVVNPVNVPLAAPFFVFWVLSPLVAWAVSQSMETEDRLNVAPTDAAQLRRVARVTWRFFETFVNDSTQHLPPDNFQETPEPKLAERTSPTNIGLYLLSVLTARDMGWIGLLQAVERIERTLTTMGRMERFRGHWFNWYDTRDLSVMSPRYISSVDSGNLAGNLLALASALREWAANPAVHQYGSLDGIGDTLAALRSALAAVPDDRRTLRPLRRRLEERIEGFAHSHRNYLAEPQLAPVRAINLVVIAADIDAFAQDLASEDERPETAELSWWTRALRENCDQTIGDASNRMPPRSEFAQRVARLAELARRMAFEMDFSFLLNGEKRLLSIGYRVDSAERDVSCYDLLASEARLASLFAIAKGDVPTEHWLRLGRPVATVGFQAALLSWSGSMFEYLMPPLMMHERTGGILNASNLICVQAQMRYGRRLGLPWGVSESAFAARDRQMNYQYYAFGVPALGLKRIQADDHVVAPYATLLAAQFFPAEAVANLMRLDRLGAFGRYGYYDAVDFTRARLPEGQRRVVVRNFMAHHHGMSIVAVGNAVLDGIHRDRFHADEVIKAAELLLQEKAPREVVSITRTADSGPDHREERGSADDSLAVSDDPRRDRRLVALLSNGSFSTHIAATGIGPSRLGEISLTRWQPDPTLDRGGTALFLRDLKTGSWWSATTEPRRHPGEQARIVFADHKAEFRKSADGIESVMEVIVAVGAAAEGRRLTVRNASPRPRQIEVTSYGEIVLDREAADQAHPAFSKMFVSTAIRDEGRRIDAMRKARGTGDRTMFLAHVLTGGDSRRPAEAETDRRAFLGRGRDLADAAAFDRDARLAGNEGHTLDPIFAIRQRLALPPNKEVALTFWTLVAETAEELDEQVRRLRQEDSFQQEERLAWTISQVQLRHASVTPDEAALFRRVASAVLWHDSRLVVQDTDMRMSLGSQDQLWPLGISGDRPIILLMTDDEADLPIVRKALRMADYFRLHALAVDLVILNEQKSGYVASLQTAIQSICDMSRRAAHVDPAQHHVYPLRRDRMGDDSFATLVAVARLVLHTRNGRISEQLARLAPPPAPPPRRAIIPALPAPERSGPTLEFPAEEFDFANGYGGFARGAREYVVRLRHGQRTPHPWINVIARPDFGFHISAGGAAFTWSQNSRDYQVTPWSNDPVTNRPGEAILIRNVATGRTVSPFAALTDDPIALHEARHGIGQSTFRVWTDWVEAEAVLLLAADAPVRLARVTVRNRGTAPLRVEVVSYAELVLGNNRGRTASVIRAWHDQAQDILVARNPFGTEVRGRAAFMAADRPLAATSVSRSAFLGSDANLRRPAALAAWPGPVDDGDPCLAAKVALTVGPGASERVTFALGDTEEGEVGKVVQRLRRPNAFDDAVQATQSKWEGFLGSLQVETPDPRLDHLVNSWLPYQALSCRLYGRSGFYQASGAFGFRDQLQDASALLLHDPGLLRAQILNAAARQFPEGDVQHWWLPRTGAGVRTLISDDVVWLAHVTAHYLQATGDTSLLDEALPFVTGPALEPGEHDAFFKPKKSKRRVSVYEHIALALDLFVARTSERGLPLILGGDWNDGMNRVGIGGRGESIWLGWFGLATLDAFRPLARARGDTERADRWASHRGRLIAALEEHGWDGDWYLRATYDDGTRLGSRENGECRIDSIAQSWASISAAAQPERVLRALDAAIQHLTDRDERLMRLFTPPFAETQHDPGYIKSYPPGVRENGGQYTHAAAWMVYALGRAGRADEALDLFAMLNPISHSETQEAADRYRVEPYVTAADVYGEGAKAGRGGWTWYTGSAGWLYRAAVEGILGIRLRDGRVAVEPALPSAWSGFRATLVRDGTRLEVEVRREGEETRVAVSEARSGPKRKRS